MRVVVVSSLDEANAAVDAASLRGERLAAQSNAGLPQGSWRLTFLPESAFVDQK